MSTRDSDHRAPRSSPTSAPSRSGPAAHPGTGFEAPGRSGGTATEPLRPARAGATDRRVQRILERARTHLGMDLAWTSHFDVDPTRSDRDVPDAQVLDVVDGDAEAMGVHPGARLERSGSFCVRVLAGGLPATVTDARRHPVTRDLPVTADLGIGSYVGAPVRDRDGRVVGMVCCLSRSANPALDDTAGTFLAFVADLVSDVHADADTDSAPGELSADPVEPEQERLVQQVRALLEQRSVRMVFQPVWRLPDPPTAAGTGHDVDAHRADPSPATPGGRLQAVAYEALARFPDTVFTRPDVAFAAAARVGLGVELERLAAHTALQQLDRLEIGTLMCVNLSAEAIVDEPTQDVLLRACARARQTGRMVGVEVTEHTRVGDYPALAAATQRLKAAGALIVVDDAGAGFASFNHILQLRPDVIKIDISLIRDIDADPVKKALTRALVTFAQESGAYLVAEGVERAEEAAAVHELGVRLVQGYLYGRPAPLDARTTSTTTTVSSPTAASQPPSGTVHDPTGV
ncbi:EAL domain-containing protein [Kineococcus sp. TBRC 1896]|uniref:EAL domain-containing protein n=1 Tax=Kineococcus mangrovi TaxID=1660183 RepID=A0ABV4I987_9ACTN